MHGFLFSAVLLLLAAVIAVPITALLGFGSVLGYLLAGFLIGPSTFGFITDVEEIMHFSEFGVVLLMFLIGLELEPRRLWQLRGSIFGLGTAQVLGCAALFAGLGYAAGVPWRIALVASLGFALSSTAMALQTYKERNALNTEGGRSAFSVLLFQDIAVIPILALLPLLAGGGGEGPSLASTGKILLLLFGVLAIGRLFLRRIFVLVASTHLREVFTALALLLVVGMALLMQKLELSMGLGAFLAGLLLADSEYKHAIEADIEPFKGLLMGLFFLSVGMSLRADDVLRAPGWVAALVAAIITLKIGVHLLLARLFRLPKRETPFFALTLSQVGEFAFVLYGTALSLKVIGEGERGLLSAVTALTFVGTSVALKIYDRFLAQRLEGADHREPDEIKSENAPVIIAGFGRVGQIVGRFLFANGIRATVLDYEPQQIEMIRRFGFKVFYGDATRMDLLEAAGARAAKVLVVAIDDVDANLALVDLARKEFPNLKIVARARNVGHVFDLKQRGVDLFERETFDSSLRLGRMVLEFFGAPAHHAYTLAQKFRAKDLELLDVLTLERASEKTRVTLAQQARQDIERLFAAENERLRESADGWSGYEKRPEQ